MGSYMPRSRLGLTGSNSFRNSGSIAVLGRAVCNLPGGVVPQRTLHTCGYRAASAAAAAFLLAAQYLPLANNTSGCRL